MDARDVILRPIITEQTMYDMDENKYTFEVSNRANKTQVRQAIEEIFEVNVEKVNILNTAPKRKRKGRYEGLTKKRRKAIVKLREGSKEIEIFGSEAEEE